MGNRTGRKKTLGTQSLSYRMKITFVQDNFTKTVGYQDEITSSMLRTLLNE